MATDKEIAIFLAAYAGISISEDPATRNLHILPNRKVLWDPIRNPTQMEQVKAAALSRNVVIDQRVKLDGSRVEMEAVVTSSRKIAPTVIAIDGRDTVTKERALSLAIYAHEDGAA